MSSAETSDPGRPRRPRRGYWLPAVIAMTVLLLIGGAVGAGDLDHSAPRTLDGRQVASEIALGIEAQQGDRTAPVLHCPDREPVRSGWRFSCTSSRSGRTQIVQVVEVDDRGRLRWQFPSSTGPAGTD